MDKLVKLKRREEIRSNPCKFATPRHLESSAPKNGGGEMNLIEGWGKVKYAVLEIQIVSANEVGPHVSGRTKQNHTAAGNRSDRTR